MTEFGKAFIFMILMINFLILIDKVEDIANNIKQTNVIIETQLKELNNLFKTWEVEVEQHTEQP